jgi:hypothetical protein
MIGIRPTILTLIASSVAAVTLTDCRGGGATAAAPKTASGKAATGARASLVATVQEREKA